MIEIIPNWHPIFVHYTIGLLGAAVIFSFATVLLPTNHHWKAQWQIVANWTLWGGCLVALATVIAGGIAYNSVAHDEASHAAMTLHRNWALPSAGLFMVLGVLAMRRVRKNSLFLPLMAIAGAMLTMTGYLGGEAVYRHGLGVMSLPMVEAGEDGHNHSHAPEPSSDDRGHDDGHGNHPH